MISIDEYTNKVVLVLGFGKSGSSMAAALIAGGSKVWIWDDNPDVLLGAKIKGFDVFNPKKNELWQTIDLLLVSPGISTLDSIAHKFVLKARLLEIFVDNDIGLFFRILRSTKSKFSIPPKVIAVTGSNGKSTTAQILYEVLEDQKYDVRLIGNIGNPALSEKKITKHTIFVIEASSYQLEYSQIFSSKYAAILNIAPDHIETVSYTHLTLPTKA